LTATNTPQPTATATDTEVATFTPQPTATLTSTPVPSNTPFPTATSTMVGDPVEIQLVSGNTVVGRGETVVFRVCLQFSPASTTSLAFSSGNGLVTGDPGVSPETFEIVQESTGPDLCTLVSMTGLTGPGSRAIGDTWLRVYFDQFYPSEPVTFLAAPPTATLEPATATAVPTMTVVPTATGTPTPLPSATTVPTSTTSPTATQPAGDPVTISLVESSDHFERGGTATFEVCLATGLPPGTFLQFSWTNGLVVDDTGISPANGAEFNPGQCQIVTMTGRTNFRGGVGSTELRVSRGLEQYLSPTVWFGI
jgi:hypothetical protein